VKLGLIGWQIADIDANANKIGLGSRAERAVLHIERSCNHWGITAIGMGAAQRPGCGERSAMFDIFRISASTLHRFCKMARDARVFQMANIQLGPLLDDRPSSDDLVEYCRMREVGYAEGGLFDKGYYHIRKAEKKAAEAAPYPGVRLGLGNHSVARNFHLLRKALVRPRGVTRKERPPGVATAHLT
jgi:hypothetical protein